ncbi:MAG: putative virulence factor [Methylococcales bacterium]
MTIRKEFLQGRCKDVVEGAGQAIEWVKEVRQTSPRIDREADALIEKLRRVRNLSRRLDQAAGRPMSIGFFGLSQAGKSYLISALAAGENGRLETEYAGKRLDFIEHINPPGGGKEATGLVTRFSRQAEAPPPGYPIQLALFSEADIVKILGNSFFNDFDRERVVFNTEATYISNLLTELQARVKYKPAGGISEDDMVDLLDYFEKRFHKSMAPLMGDYWPTAIDLAPVLEVPDRARLFSVLWGEIDEFTGTYRQLRDALSKLSFSQTVFTPLNALVVARKDGRLSQADSIMNVDILERLGRDSDDCVEVKPIVEGRLQDAVQIPRSILAALTLEMTFPLIEKPVAQVLEQIDLLDFPGYRGRYSLGDLHELTAELQDTGTGSVAQLFLRGKVAYLFERYTDYQEMNVLVVCTPSDKQSDVTSVGPVLDNWVEVTQGKTAELRSGRTPGLIWSITMFDKRINQSLGHTEDMLQIAWGSGGMMKMALLERFGQYPWVNEWSRGRPFDNLFLVRKPRMPVSFLTLAGGTEQAVDPQHENKLQLMRTTFIRDVTVQKHFSDPEAAWDTMLCLNDGGIGSLVNCVTKAADLQVKLDRIAERLNDTLSELIDNRLGPYFQSGGAEEVEKKRKIAAGIIAELTPRAAFIGELIYSMGPVEDHLRSLYLRVESVSTISDEQAEEKKTSDHAANVDDSMFDLDFGLDDETRFITPDLEKHQSSSGTSRFVAAVMREWTRHLRDLPERSDLLRFFGFPKKAVEGLTNEIIAATSRMRIEERLARAIERSELETSATRSRLVERQVRVVATILNEFLATLGMAWVPLPERPDSRIRSGAKVFVQPAPIGPGQLPDLPEQPARYFAYFVKDWLDSFANLVVSNAGHSAGRDITLEQNQRLGEVLKLISGGTRSVPESR